MSAGAYLDAQIQRIWNEFKSQRRSIELMQLDDRKRIAKTERDVKLLRARTHPKRKQLPRITK